MSAMSLIAELRRRNVLRMAGLYLVASWLIVQVSSTILPMFAAPDWLPRSVVVLLAIGFVPMLVFSWVYELTPAGVRRDADVPIEQSIGVQTGRRIDRAIIVVLLVALGYFATDKFVLAPRREAATRADAPRSGAAADAARPPVSASSIAVLPFVNMSGDAKNEYFSDGITEEILNALAQIPDLKVAARTSAFAFKGKEPDLRKVGEVLGVATVLEGSVQREGDAVRITAKLADARSGFQLWSERYDRQLTSVFAIEDEIARAIADKLEVQFGAAGAIAGKTADPRAHELYLRGLSLLAARGPGLRTAADLFGQAVAIDPQYAQAWGALAQTEQLIPGYVQTVDREGANARAEVAAKRALAIDPDAPASLVAMAQVHMQRNEWAPAAAAYRRAIALAPGDAEVVDQYAQFLFEVGQLEPALQRIDEAFRLDPLSAIIPTIRAGILMALDRQAEGLAQLDSVSRAHPDFYPARVTAAFYNLQLRRFAESEAQFRQVARIVGVDPEAKAILARGVADPSERAAALQSLASSPANADFRSDQLVEAALYTALGDRERAFERLRAFAEQHASSANGMLWTGVFAPLRDDPRFAAVLASLNLPYRPAEDSAQ